MEKEKLIEAYTEFYKWLDKYNAEFEAVTDVDNTAKISVIIDAAFRKDAIEKISAESIKEHINYLSEDKQMKEKLAHIDSIISLVEELKYEYEDEFDGTYHVLIDEYKIVTNNTRNIIDFVYSLLPKPELFRFNISHKKILNRNQEFLKIDIFYPDIKYGIKTMTWEYLIKYNTAMKVVSKSFKTSLINVLNKMKEEIKNKNNL